MSCSPHYLFSIDGHNLTIIEADGENTVPITVSAIDVYAGQRYSAILHANQPVNNYWVRAQPELLQYTGFENGTNSAILRYEGAKEVEPKTKSPSGLKPVQEKDLHALDSPAAPGLPYPGGADKVLNLTIGFSDETQLFNISGVTFHSPTVPVLLQILSGAQLAQDLLPAGSVYGLPLNSVIEINLLGLAPQGNPVSSCLVARERTTA